MIGVPSASAIHPGARLWPIRLASVSLLPATVLVAASKTKGDSLSAGAATAIGFVPMIDSAPKVGTTMGGQEVMHMPIISCSNAIIAW